MEKSAGVVGYSVVARQTTWRIYRYSGGYCRVFNSRQPGIGRDRRQ